MSIECSLVKAVQGVQNRGSSGTGSFAAVQLHDVVRLAVPSTMLFLTILLNG